MIRYPEKINSNDKIGIIAPSMSANLEKIDKAEENLKRLGFSIVESNSVRKDNIKWVSNIPGIRAKEFIDMWKNAKVKYMLSARGGEFAMEILPYIDNTFEKEKLYENSKWLQGYSDITALLFYLTTKYNIATIQSNNVSDYAMNPLHESLVVPFKITQDLKENVQENYEKWQLEENKEDLTYQYNLTENSKCKLLKGNNARFSGRLIGGCLDVISQYVGTKWDNVDKFISQFENEGIIWHIENCELQVTEMYRRLWFMKEQGWFKNARGIIIGRTYSDKPALDFEYIDAIQKGLGSLNIPIVYDIDIGHTMPQWTIVNGSLGEIEFNNGKCRLIQKFI